MFNRHATQRCAGTSFTSLSVSFTKFQYFLWLSDATCRWDPTISINANAGCFAGEQVRCAVLQRPPVVLRGFQMADFLINSSRNPRLYVFNHIHQLFEMLSLSTTLTANTQVSIQFRRSDIQRVCLPHLDISIFSIVADVFYPQIHTGSMEEQIFTFSEETLVALSCAKWHNVRVLCAVARLLCGC